MDSLFADVIKRFEELHEDYFGYLEGLKGEQLDWSPGEQMNSLCVLAVHVTAAERFWVGIAIDDMTERDRAAEFRASGCELDAPQGALCRQHRLLQSGFCGTVP